MIYLSKYDDNGYDDWPLMTLRLTDCGAVVYLIINSTMMGSIFIDQQRDNWVEYIHTIQPEHGV